MPTAADKLAQATLEETQARANVAISGCLPDLSDRQKQLLDALIAEAFHAGRQHALYVSIKQFGP